ncbi:MAG: hypothetical protein A3H57_00545 [Candidatus Taylorbacteria bacterium RIFCSPLOWO2_02_FULL_43_11]|uniref:Uncharacterized protein n=1 Tax=Candidatus Taylorbacteria bacterium RIFCSPHIGHO2_02_FULL_43_32b TaxID=1802306 RepID=A0A1G2MME6_9BACT|nr:MAG: hypothetical protein A3C72_04930 [Candidatus Taylorbacteria bacterium RIFCSPHIGHO2_02_FULL_43_32b]OHA37823.1 MAG: hypothetical protein A3H57_00545 [Candidatus Taylorbacteria bacterium RIFCSPLOWO2_02_FULL_43_11]
MSTIFIAAALCLTFFYSSPTYNAMTGNQELRERSVVELKEEKSRYEAALQKVREIEVVKTGLMEKYNSIDKENREKLNKLVPDGIDSVRLLVDIESVANSAGMSLRDITFEQAKDGLARIDDEEVTEKKEEKDVGEYSYIVLNFSVEGNYDSLASFLENLDRSLRVVDITEISINSSYRDTGFGFVFVLEPVKTTKIVEPMYKMRVALKAYYLK